MLRGIYTAASAMIANMTMTDTMADNIANVNTAGFKKSTAHFQNFSDVLMQRLTPGGSTQIGELSNGERVYATTTNFGQGEVQRTGNPLNVAIEGDGFFTLKNDKGEELYTRNGSFHLDANGNIRTVEGHFLQNAGGGNVTVALGKEFKIDSNGLISQIGAEGSSPQYIQISRFANNQALDRVGGSVYKAQEGAQKLPAPSNSKRPPYSLTQGELELSNTNMINEIVNSINGLRTYDMLQKNIQVHNETLQKAVNDVGRYK